MPATKHSKPDWLQIGKYRLQRNTIDSKTSFWLDRAGEGMEVSEADLEELLETYFNRNF